MAHPLINDGRIHSPFQIFVRAGHGLSDAELLCHFGLSTYQAAPDSPSFGCHAILSDAGDWTMLADDYRYTLWHSKSTRPAIESLAARHDIFACSEGDCDCSFDFLFYHHGKLARKLVVESPKFTDRIVVEDIGEPLPAEARLLGEPFQYDIGLKLAASLGIKTTFERKDLRLYAPSGTVMGVIP